LRTALLTLLALIAFAANSILCRLALAQGALDAGSFTVLRLAAGAASLALVLRLQRRAPAGDWLSALALLLYAAPFAFAYNTLSAGTGALVLFGAVQITMISTGLGQGERPRPREWAGVAAAVAGLVTLVRPGLAAPSMVGALSMAVAGIAWGVYSLRGRGTPHAVAATAGNFLRAVPFALLLGLATLRFTHFSRRGVLLALVSGAVTSGLGYVAWYAALRGLTATRAATAQLVVPLLTAFAGVLFLGEHVTSRVIVAAVLILGGVLVVARARTAA